MRLRAALAGALIVPAVVALAACAPPSAQSGASSDTSAAGSSAPGSAASSAASAASSGASSSAAPSSTAPPSTLGPQVPADTSVAPAVARDHMPTVSGGFGTKPTIMVPSTPPPDTLQRVVLTKGDGPVSAAGDWLVVNYLGQVWGGKVFDNSYDRGSPFTVQIGGSQKMVVDGWDVGLRGVAQGSRVLLSFPPQDGYGTAGNPPDISGTDTLIFVVDVVKIIPANAGGDASAVPQSTPAGLPSVGGQLGAEPTLSIPSSLPVPTATKVVVLDKGTGAPAKAGDVLVQYVASTWDGSQTEKSWPDPSGKDQNAGSGPQSLPLTSGAPFEALIGVPIGSRVVMTMAADSSNGTPALAWVMDLIAQQDVAPATTGATGSGATSGATTSGATGGAATSGANAPPTTPTS